MLTITFYDVGMTARLLKAKNHPVCRKLSSVQPDFFNVSTVFSNSLTSVEVESHQAKLQTQRKTRESGVTGPFQGYVVI